jgi:hypothetical protein
MVVGGGRGMHVLNEKAGTAKPNCAVRYQLATLRTIYKEIR